MGDLLYLIIIGTDDHSDILVISRATHYHIIIGAWTMGLTHPTLLCGDTRIYI